MKKKYVIMAVYLVLPFITVAKEAKTISYQLQVGAAVKDVTPTPEMFPLHRAPNITISGVLDPLHVRVIAFSDGQNKALMVCTETGRAPYGPQYVQALSDHTGIPKEAIFYTATHSHACPEVTEAVDLSFDPDSKTNPPTHEQLWAKLVMDQMLAAADEALAAMKPASIGIGYGTSYINVNRRAQYNEVEKDGSVKKVYNLGWNPAGVSDHQLDAIQCNDQQGNPIAFIINHATHGTVMHGNTIENGLTGVSADFPGLVSSYLESDHAGAVALWTSGAAGDQNPVIQNDQYTPDPKTGVFSEKFSNSYDILSFIAKWHYADIKNALAAIPQFESNDRISYGLEEATIPGKNGGTVGVSLQILRIGSLTFIGFPGELYASTGLYLKKASPLKNTIIVNHVWQRSDQEPSYYPDDLAVEQGGAMAGRAKYLPGYLNKTLKTLMLSLIKKTNK